MYNGYQVKGFQETKREPRKAATKLTARGNPRDSKPRTLMVITFNYQPKPCELSVPSPNIMNDNEREEMYAYLYAEDEGAVAARRHNEWEAHWVKLEEEDDRHLEFTA